jgi:hypothetical protein
MLIKKELHRTTSVIRPIMNGVLVERKEGTMYRDKVWDAVYGELSSLIEAMNLAKTNAKPFQLTIIIEEAE